MGVISSSAYKIYFKRYSSFFITLPNYMLYFNSTHALKPYLLHHTNNSLMLEIKDSNPLVIQKRPLSCSEPFWHFLTLPSATFSHGIAVSQNRGKPTHSSHNRIITSAPYCIFFFFCGQWPRSRCYGRTAAFRLIVQHCDEDY